MKCIEEDNSESVKYLWIVYILSIVSYFIAKSLGANIVNEFIMHKTQYMESIKDTEKKPGFFTYNFELYLLVLSIFIGTYAFIVSIILTHAITDSAGISRYNYSILLGLIIPSFIIAMNYTFCARRLKKEQVDDLSGSELNKVSKDKLPKCKTLCCDKMFLMILITYGFAFSFGFLHSILDFFGYYILTDSGRNSLNGTISYLFRVIPLIFFVVVS